MVVPPSVSATSIGAVAYTPQSPAASEQVQARKNVYAAPFDAMSYSGLQINGGMSVSQELGTVGASVTNAAPNKYVVDNFVASINHSTGVVACSQGGEIAVATGATLANYVGLTATTGLASLSGSNYFSLLHRIEGYRTASLSWGGGNAQPITIGFWVMGNGATGHMSVAVRNAAGNRAHAVDVTVAGGGVWEWKTVTIQGDTTGTWEKTNLGGIEVWFTFAAAATWQAPTGTWTASGAIATLAQTNLVAANGNGVFIGNVIVLPGIEAPSAARSAFVMRPFDNELALCQRHYRKSFNYATRPGQADSQGMMLIYQDGITNATHNAYSYQTNLLMRNTPTVTIYSPSTGASGKARDYLAGADLNSTASNIGAQGFDWNVVTAAAAATVYLGAHYVADARL